MRRPQQAQGGSLVRALLAAAAGAGAVLAGAYALARLRGGAQRRRRLERLETELTDRTRARAKPDA